MRTLARELGRRHQARDFFHRKIVCFHDIRSPSKRQCAAIKPTYGRMDFDIVKTTSYVDFFSSLFLFINLIFGHRPSVGFIAAHCRLEGDLISWKNTIFLFKKSLAWCILPSSLANLYCHKSSWSTMIITMMTGPHGYYHDRHHYLYRRRRLIITLIQPDASLYR